MPDYPVVPPDDAELAFIRLGNYLEGVEQPSDPPAPVGNKGRLFFKDNGAGKTQLVVRFGSGATQVIATEP